MLVKYNRANRLSIIPVRLKPGVNQVSDEKWAAASAENAHGQKIRELMETINEHGQPVIEVVAVAIPVTDDVSDDLTSDDDDISGLSESRAVYIVSQTLDKGLLAQWKTTDRRKKVQAAIKAQLKKLEDARGKSESDGGSESGPEDQGAG